jgi:ribonucleotide reductase alpha subunit
MCPNICKGLSDVYGDEYETLYWQYVSENKYITKMKARELMKAILDSQLETGTPYIAYKDSVNKKSNQKNIGTIKSSNLCIEILEYSDDKEYAVCNLASIAINKFIEPFIFDKNDKWEIYTKENCKYCTYAKTFLNNKNIIFTEIKNIKCNSYPQILYNDILIGGYDDLFDFVKGTFDYDKLYNTAYIATKNLNKIIDINYYPVPEAKLSNLKHRPIGLGIQGLADALVLLKIPFDSNESLEFNKKVMETIYMASITASNDIAKAYQYYAQVPVTGSGFDNPQPLNILPYDEMRFEGNEAKIATILSSSFDGSNANTPLLYLHLQAPFDFTSVDIDYFAIRRWVSSIDNIIINSPGTVMGSGFILPKYPSPTLKANLPSIIENLTNKNLV